MSNAKKCLKRIALISLVSGVAAVSTVGISAKQYFDGTEKAKEELVDYLDSNNEDIIREIEVKFGIKFDSIKYKFVKFSGDARFRTAMSYDPSLDIIKVNLEAGFTALQMSDVGFLSSFYPHITVKGSFCHESGHDYTNQVYNRLLKEGRLPENQTMNIRLNHKLLWEGIGRYFQTEFGEFNNPYIPDTVIWPSSTEEFTGSKFGIKGNDFYEYGRILVKPILDKLGVKKGIEEILSNPTLTNEELFDPAMYQTRIIDSYRIQQ